MEKVKEEKSPLDLSSDQSYSDKSENTKETYVSPHILSPTLNKSVEEFFKQSGEIQSEIRKLTGLFHQISPKRKEEASSKIAFSNAGKEWSREENEISPNISVPNEEFHEEEEREIEDQQDYWKDINELLEKYGFNPVILYQEIDNEVPDWNSLSDALVDVLTGYAHQVTSLGEAENNIYKLTRENKELKTQLESNEEELNKWKEQGKEYNNAIKRNAELEDYNRMLKNRLEKTNEISDLEKENKELKIEMERKDEELKRLKEKLKEYENTTKRNVELEEYNRTLKKKLKKANEVGNDKDIAILNIKRMLNTDKVKLFEETQKEVKMLRERVKCLEEQANSEYNEKVKVLNLIMNALSLNSFSEIPSSIFKMQQVVLSLPRIEELIESILNELFPDEYKVGEEIYANVLPAIKHLKQRTFELTEFKKKILEIFRSSDDIDLFEKANALRHFCKLFSIKQTDQITGTIDNVFVFVHEMKRFLSFARQALGMPNDQPISSVLEEVTRYLENS
ncbi:unnamed protein product [Blepharisma stoltei]|uniref:Centrosomal protein of 70 kDa n=1 Tax=Blepharisma stoltei TaxID=1481888 RepID=A0AAU9K789_9CILI|nr:unnamed protein product [Blepharisma stoltei]